MWYEILPSFSIIVVAMAAPHAISYIANKLTIDNFFRRSMLSQEEALQYLRDKRLTGNPYVLKGLESIPDQ